MWLIFVLLICLINSSLSLESDDCYFTVLYSNGSRYWCLDEQCNDYIDIISLENDQCKTNYLSLKFSSYSKYEEFVKSSSFSLSSMFELGRPNIERLLQIEFLSPLDNDNPFKIEDLYYLTKNISSNIDTYEFIFNENISNNNLTLFIDKEIFISNEQIYIDTLRLIFNCTNSKRVEWELVKSIQYFPDSPCKKQIDFLKKDFNSFNINILVSFILFYFIYLFSLSR